METPILERQAGQARKARLATIESLQKNILPAYLDPIPPRKTIHNWFRRANIPRFKSNPACRNGGGEVYYSVAAVEKFFRQRMAGGMAEVSEAN